METSKNQALKAISEGLILISNGINMLVAESKESEEESDVCEIEITKDKLKEVMIEKSRLGKEQEIRTILYEQGVVRLSDLDSKVYFNVYQKIIKL